MRCRTFDEFQTQLQHRQKRRPFKKLNSGLEVVVHNDMSDFDPNRWNEIVGTDSIFLRLDYLQALMKSFEGGFEYRFACFHEDGNLVGVAAFQITYFETSDLKRNMDNAKPMVRWFNKGIMRNGSTLRFNMLICGNAFASGSHGFRFLKHISEPNQFSAVLQAVEMIKEKELAAGNKISAVLIKDFYPESFGNTHVFSDDKYSEFLVDPNMIMPVRPEWKTFDDYLNSLTSKYRTKAKAAYKRSVNLEIRSLHADELAEHKERFIELYETVHYKADFRVGKLNFEAFYNLSKDLGDKFFIKGLFLEGNMVGFMSGFEYDNILDAHMVGIDYEYNYEHAIYPTMLYEYVKEAIDRGVERISYGRTAMEIKSTVGAFPVDLKIFIKHRSKAPNHLLRILFNYVKPAEFDQRVPYKERILAEMRMML